MKKLWQWLGAAVVVFFVVQVSFKAFTTPWAFNGAHIVFGFYVAIALVVGSVWGGVWLREGTAGVKARWAGRQQTGRAMPPRFYMASLLTWIGVAVALVVAFNLFHRGG